MGGRVAEVRMDVNEELKFLLKLKKIIIFFWGGEEGVVSGVGGGRLGEGQGSRVDVNREVKVL